jgi:hypothetical protein
MSFLDHLAAADKQVVRSLTGGPVTYTPGVGGPVVVNGIFDAIYNKVEVGIAGVSSCGPAVFLRLVDLPTNPADDLAALVTVDGTDYTIHESLLDGMGTVICRLHKA